MMVVPVVQRQKHSQKTIAGLRVASTPNSQLPTSNGGNRVIIMTMIMVNIFEVKAKLSEYLDAVSRGERVMICKRNRPIAELRPVDAAPAARRLGTAPGSVTLPPSFFEPLPDD